jgi:uncharacterized protein
VRPILVVLLLALALTGCGIEIVSGSATPASSPPTVGSAPDGASDVPVGSTIDAAPGADDSDTRAVDERSAVSITDRFWSGWFADQGLRYVAPTVEGGYTGTDGPSCAGEPSVPGNAYYCPAGNFLTWDDDLMRAGYTQIGDAWVYLVIAHEWGHAIQAQLPDRFVSRAVELQADCLAGAALQGAADQGLVRIEPGDDEEIAQTLQAVADDYPWTDESSHGNARQRTSAFQGGVRDGVEGCLRL